MRNKSRSSLNDANIKPLIIFLDGCFYFWLSFLNNDNNKNSHISKCKKKAIHICYSLLQMFTFTCFTADEESSRPLEEGGTCVAGGNSVGFVLTVATTGNGVDIVTGVKLTAEEIAALAKVAKGSIK